jgi:hypothetical protein
MRPIISLTTDFGIQNSFVGVMKGVIWGIVPEAQIADITHQIPPQNIRLGAYALWRIVPFFPAGSVHIAVIDPGVGTKRRPIGLKIGENYFIIPDNGLITPVLEDGKRSGAEIKIVHLNNHEYHLSKVSNTFHGRDIFAPVGAHLAAGVPVEKMGDRIDDPVLIDLPQPIKTDKGWVAHITIIDVFGNLTTDLPASELSDDENVTFHLKGHRVEGLVPSYGHREEGELVALVDSEDYIEIGAVNGNAAEITGAKIGDTIEVILNE